MLEQAIGVALLAGAGVLGIRANGQWANESTRRVYELQFPHNLKPADACDFMRSLAAILPPTNRQLFARRAVTMEVWATRAGVRHRLHLPRNLANSVVTQLRAAIPGVRITAAEIAPLARLRVGMEIGTRGGLVPFNIPNPAAITTATLASLQPLWGDEAAVMQWTLCPTARRIPRAPKRSGRHLIKWHWVIEGILNMMEPPIPSPAQLAAAEAKLAEPVFTGVCRIGAAAGTTRRARQIVRQVRATLNIAQSRAASFSWQPGLSLLAADRIERAAVPMFHFPALVNAAELTALTAWPLNSPVLPGVHVGAARQLPPSPAIPRTGHVLGTANFPGAERPVAIGITEALRHVHMIGPTGSGKSTLLINLITQDMEARRGVAVFDPKGDLIKDILDRVPANRKDDVIVIDPADPERSVGLNLLEHAGMELEVVVDQVVGVFKRLFAGYWGPRTDDVLRSALLSLMRTPGTTLCDVPLILNDSAFRAKILSRVDDPIGLAPFWRWYEGLGDRQRSQVTGPVANKLRALLLRRSVRDIFGQSKSTINLGEVLAQNKILLVHLPKGQIGEDTSALLGSLLVMRLWQEVQKRGTLAADKRTPFTCYIDEFHEYLNLPSSIADILALARGYGLSLVMAHQEMGQLTKEVKDAVLANARSKVVFQTGAADARTLAEELAPYVSASDLQNLDPYQAMALIYVEGKKAVPVSIATAEAPETTGDGAALRAAVAQRFGRLRSEIEQQLRARLVADYTEDQEPDEPGMEPV